MEDSLSVVHSKMGTFKDAKCMEQFLNSCCSERNLNELMGALNGDVCLNPALFQVGRQTLEHYQRKMYLQDNLPLGDLWLLERFCGQLDERFIQNVDEKRMKDFLSVVRSKTVTFKDAKRMEGVLNSCCSEQNLHELMGVLNGDVSFNPALVQVARKISKHYESKMDFQDILALGRALADERLFGQPEERLSVQRHTHLVH